MLQDKKATIKNKITAELQELTGIKWSFGLTVDLVKDNKKIKGTFYSNQYATLSADDALFGEAVCNCAANRKIHQGRLRLDD